MIKKINKNTFFGGALILTTSITVSKIMGMFYRLPLANVLGSFGLGLYQTVFPVYALFVCIGSSSVTVAVSRCVAKYNATGDFVKVKGTLDSATLFSGAFTVVSASLLFAFSPQIARLQGVKQASTLYKCVAPSIIFAGFSGVIKGYFQGLMDMTPTALSEIVSQSAKPLLGLTLSTFFKDTFMKAVFAVLSITFSELTAFLLLLLTYVYDRKTKKGVALVMRRNVDFYKTLLPVTLGGLLLPLSNAVDSFLVINALKTYTEHAVGLYGMFTGVCLTVLSIPASLSYGLATAILPSVSALNGNGQTAKAKKGEYFALTLTVYVALPIAVFIYYFAPNVLSLLFKAGAFSRFSEIVVMIKLATPYAVLLPVLSTANAVLYGKGKEKVPLISLCAGVFVKTATEIILLKYPELNVFGYIIAVDVCYILAVFCDLVYIIRDVKFIIFTLKTAILSFIAVYTGYAITGLFGFAVSVVFTGLIYLAGTVVLKPYGKQELDSLLKRFAKRNT